MNVFLAGLTLLLFLAARMARGVVSSLSGASYHPPSQLAQQRQHYRAWEETVAECTGQKDSGYAHAVGAAATMVLHYVRGTDRGHERTLKETPQSGEYNCRT